jgi:hypothetical protein
LVFLELAKTLPNWSGFMQDWYAPSDISHKAADKSLIYEFIDFSCVYFTMKLNMTTACVTFDQPMSIEAVEIVHSSKMNIACHLVFCSQ